MLSFKIKWSRLGPMEKKTKTSKINVHEAFLWEIQLCSGLKCCRLLCSKASPPSFPARWTNQRIKSLPRHKFIQHKRTLSQRGTTLHSWKYRSWKEPHKPHSADFPYLVLTLPFDLLFLYSRYGEHREIFLAHKASKMSSGYACSSIEMFQVTALFPIVITAFCTGWNASCILKWSVRTFRNNQQKWMT